MPANVTELRFGEKTCFWSGQFGISLLNQVLIMWAMYSYAPPPDRGLPQLLPVGLTGVALFVARFFDLLNDPFIAYFSDRHRSRWGRRKPFIAVGAPLGGLFFLLIFFPPVPHVSAWNMVYLTSMVALYFSFYSMVAIPYTALLPEIAVTLQDRLSLSVGLAACMMIGSVAGMLGSPILMEKAGFRIMALVCGVAAVLGFVPTLAGVRERVRVTDDYSRLHFLDSIRSTLANKAFLVYTVAIFSFQLGWNILTASMTYLVVVLMRLDEVDVGKVLGLSFVAMVVSIPLARPLATKLGKKTLMGIALAGLGISLFLLAFVGLDWMPISPAVQGTTLVIIVGSMFAITLVLDNALIADIIDYDEKLTGLRREGMYNGVKTMIFKVAVGLGFAINGLLMQQFGYSRENDLGVRLLGPVSGVFLLAAAVFWRYYPLTDQHVAEIKKELDAAKGEAQPLA
jgi:GPH family glycoside/pentoside/hexuronide:cation symporter